MTTPMTPRDPFTDEDVRKARDAYVSVTNIDAMDAMRSALLAGTERLRAQGTWNEAIEAAAKYHDLAASIAEQRKVEAIARGDAVYAAHYRREIVEHEQHARCIRALKRPEAS